VAKLQYASSAAVALAVLAAPAHAQRADENAVAAAEDAFGTRVGNENTGLYSQTSARGFNPQQAGNARLFGLYFDQQAFFGPRLVQTNTIRVGLAAQSYPFPAPTGVVDINLYTPSDTRVISVGTQLQTPVGLNNASLDIKTPLIDGKLGMVAGTVWVWNKQGQGGGSNESPTGTVLFRWTPTDDLEFIPYFYNMRSFDVEATPSLYTAGAFVPPDHDRTSFFGQKWAIRENNDYNIGGIGRWTPKGPWQVQAGLFRSTSAKPVSHTVFYRNIQQDGTATLEVLGNPFHANRSTSGEARVTGVFTEGAWRHTIHMAVRGRQTYRLFGGSDTVSFGQVRLGEYIPRPKPVFNYGVRDTDDVTQIMPGVSYVGQWAGVGEASVGLQKAFYDREFGKENGTPTAARSRPWLYNGTLAVYATPDLALYAGYTRGLEEFGTAPENALNRGQPMPAAVTKQFDAGLRYRIAPGLSLVAGVFEVTKPYYDRDTTNLYTIVGDLSHRGIELSFTGRLVPGLNVVAGAMLLKPRVSGLSVDRGLIAKVPPGTPSYAFSLNVQYGPASWRGFAIDAAVESEGSKYANRLNTFELPGYSTLALGARYAFPIWGGNRASVRAQLLNAFNAVTWQVEGGSGRYSRPNPRGYLLRLAADF